MPQLLFKREFQAAIREGRKTTTLRRWKSCRLAAGATALVPGVGKLRITSCDRIDLKSLKPADARADGFSSLAELRRVLQELYPDQAHDGRQWYRIAFEVISVLPPKTKANIATPIRKRRKATAHLPGPDKKLLASRIRAELDKVVRQTGSLFGL
jgi:hypothetical protein